MKSGVIYFVTSLLAMTALTDTISDNFIIVQPGPVKVKKGNNVSLCCQLTNGSQNAIPVLWQSPPKFKTRTSNCQTFGPPFQQKYDMSCAECPFTCFRWYNMTITDVQWADRGKYRCIHTRHKGLVDLQVLVPVREMSLTHDFNSTSKPLALSKDVHVMLTCTTDCAYPAPTIAWFENDQPFNDSATVNNTEVGCTGDKEGQKRAISTVIVTGKNVDNDRKESKFFCTAENVIGEPKISSLIVINYDGEPNISRIKGIIYDDIHVDANTGQRVQAVFISIAAGAGIGLVNPLGVACFFSLV